MGNTASQDDHKRGHLTCAVEVSPGIADAGAKMTLRGTVSCVPPCDLRGHRLLVNDEDGNCAATLEMTAFDGETNETGETKVNAPLAAGDYRWTAVCPAVAREGVSYAEAPAQISFTVKAHTMRIVAWDVPTAIVTGKIFKMKIGIKCSSGCDFTNGEFAIHDHEGKNIAAGTLSGERWPGTTGLYFAEAELAAPVKERIYDWSVKVPASDSALPHAGGEAGFGVRVVNEPECLVTVETIDKTSRAPLKGARVVMHPYMTITDERGIAEVRVAKGAYKLFVSQRSYLTFGLPVEVSADLTARAEMELEPVPERN